MNNLLIKFKSKDSPFGVTRETLKAIAEELDVSETMAVHLALSRLAREVLPAYPMDDGLLSAQDLAHFRDAAKPTMPQAKLRKTRFLL